MAKYVSHYGAKSCGNVHCSSSRWDLLLNDSSYLFQKFVRLQLGTGIVVCFWRNMWVDANTFTDLSHRLFQVALGKNYKVVNYGQWGWLGLDMELKMA